MTTAADAERVRALGPTSDRGVVKKPIARKVPVIGDVARVAGVSVPTVSRVLTGAARVSAEKRERVERAIEELEYRPSSTARALVHGSKMVAVIAGDTSKYGYASTIQGVEEAARAAGYVVMILAVQASDQQSIQSELDLVLTQPLAGAIVLQFDQAGADALRTLPRTFPVVAVAGSDEGQFAHASLDEVAGAIAATEYLLSLGHRTVHHVSVPHGVNEHGRTIGWRSSLETHGLTPPPIVPATWEPQSGQRIGFELATSDTVTAILAGNDEIAMGIISGLRQGGKSVPEDVSVVGFDDHPLASLWIPALTTVSQDFVGMGRRAFALLLESLGGGLSSIRSIEPTHLIVRSSAAAPKADA